MIDKVAQLVKTAKENKKEKDDNAGKKVAGALYAASAAGAASAGIKARKDRVLGYKSVYHGTSDSIAKDIRKKGLKASKGGSSSGASTKDDAALGTDKNVKRSKGKTYITTRKDVASNYASIANTGRVGSPSKGVVKANIPHRKYQTRHVDSLSKSNVEAVHGPHSRRGHKAFGSMGKSIPPSQIEGSSKYKGTKQYATKKNMKSYLGNKSGRARFAKGVGSYAAKGGLGALAVGAAAYGAKKLVEKVRGDKKKS